MRVFAIEVAGQLGSAATNQKCCRTKDQTPTKAAVLPFYPNFLRSMIG
jgi:hypothetical protein